MRAVLSFFSMLALGLMIAAIVIIGATGGVSGPARLPMSGPYLDYVSVVIGLGVGLVIAVLGQISWSELPHRAVSGCLPMAAGCGSSAGARSSWRSCSTSEATKLQLQKQTARDRSRAAFDLLAADRV